MRYKISEVTDDDDDDDDVEEKEEEKKRRREMRSQTTFDFLSLFLPFIPAILHSEEHNCASNECGVFSNTLKVIYRLPLDSTSCVLKYCYCQVITTILSQRDTTRR